jgi:hypothetical protein
LRIKEAHGSLNDRDSLIVSLDLVNSALMARYYSDQVQSEILGVQVRGERVGQAPLHAGRDLKIIASSSQVPHNESGRMSTLWQGVIRTQGTTNDRDVHRLGLVVGEINYCLRRAAIDKLDAKDLGIWEGDRDTDFQVGDLGSFKVLL